MSKFDASKRKPQFEDIDSVDLQILDKTSLSEIKDIIAKFAGDKTFAPREVSTVFDTDVSEVDIDSDMAPEFGYDFEEAFDECNRVRDDLNNARAK